MGKGYSQGRTPNESRDVVTLPDGSTWDPGFVQFSDGTEAAVEERRYDADVSREMRDERARRAAGGTAPSVDEYTEEARDQRRDMRDYVAPYRSAALRGDDPNGTRQLLYGRAVTLNAGQKVQGIYTPEQPKPEVWTVYIQPLPEADGKTPFASAYGHGDLSSIIVTVQWAIGGVTFSRTVVVQTCTVTRFQVVARKVMIDLQAFKIGDPSLGGQTFTVNVAASAGQENEIFGTGALWIPQASPGGAASGPSQLLLPNAAIPINAGSLMSAVVIARTVPGAGPFYPMFFNQPQAPVNGDPPILVMPPFTAVGGTSTAEDEFVTSWDFDNGLAFGISTTTDTFTNAGAVTVRLDYKVGT